MKKLSSALFFLSFTLTFFNSFSQGPGCPNVNAGPDQVLACGVSCANLTSTLFETGATTSYTVTNIPYAQQPSPSGAWTNTFVNTDDIWSSVINLPFTFCFYGASYNQLVVGANGVISFNTGYAGQFCPWAFTAAVPSGNLPLNSIFGAYHDIDPSVCGQIRYAISGAYPCRTFMFDFNQVCHYSCNNLRTTQRIVLYETSNVVEVYIGNKPACGGWNGGRAVIGMQNAAGNTGIVAPGRQTGNWTASNEAWRFTPSGAPNYSIEWYENDLTGSPVATGNNVQVCPSNQFTSYSALLTYTNCDNSIIEVWDAVQVELTGPAQPDFTVNSVCAGETIVFDGPTVPGASYFWSGPGGWTASIENPTRPTATSGMSGQYELFVIVAGCTSSVASQQVLVVDPAAVPTFTTNSPVCLGENIALSGPTIPGAVYVWSGPAFWFSIDEDPVFSSNTPGVGTHTYNLFVVVNGCTSATATANVVVNPTPPVPNYQVNSPICTGETINFNGPTIPGATYLWTGPGGFSANTEDFSLSGANTGMNGDYSLNVVVSGCTSQAAVQTITVNGPVTPSFSASPSICEGEDIDFDAINIPGATYFWSGPNGWTSNIEDPFIASAPAAAGGLYSLYVVLNGCTSNTASSPVFVTPEAAPQVTTNSPVCEGSTLEFSTPFDSTYTYFWSGPNGWIDSIAEPQIVGSSAANSGTYTMYVVSNGCTTNTNSFQVTVNPIPAAPAITTNAPVCEEGSLTLNGPAAAGATYVWSGPNSWTSSQQNNTINPVALTDAGTYSLYIVSLGCTSATSNVSVTINDKADVDPQVNPLTPCAGSLVNFDADITLQAPSVVAGSGWDVDGNGVPDYITTQATHVYSAPGNYTAGFAIITSGNCTTTVTVPITVNPKPTVSYTGPSEVCGTTVGLGSSAQIASPGVMTGFEWFYNGQSVGNGQNTSFDFPASPFQTVTGTVIGTSADGCSDTASYSINLNPKPEADFTFNDDCVGLTIPFVNTSGWNGTPSPGTTVDYGWSFGDGQNSVILNPTHTYLTGDNYTVTLTALSSTGCADTIQYEVLASTLPSASFEFEVQCFQNVLFNSTSNGFGNDLIYDWNFDNGSTSTDSVLIYEYETAGNYNVSLTVTNSLGCADTITVPVQVDPSTPLSELDMPNILTPNGDNVNDELTLDPSFEECQDYEMLIFNRWGVQVFKQVKGSASFRGLDKAGAKLTTGVYFFTIRAGELEKNGTITISY